MAEFEPTERELEALKVLWDCGEATVRDIADAMNAAGDSELAYTTVLSLLQVMEQKGLVEHRRAGKAYLYVPRVERQSTFRRLASGFLDTVFDGALDQYLAHALESKRLSEAELDKLEEMVAEARARRGVGKGKTQSASRATRPKGKQK